jgi:hypothetical protein
MPLRSSFPALHNAVAFLAKPHREILGRDGCAGRSRRALSTPMPLCNAVLPVDGGRRFPAEYAPTFIGM